LYKLVHLSRCPPQTAMREKFPALSGILEIARLPCLF
jgi:hypothetical protein